MSDAFTRYCAEVECGLVLMDRVDLAEESQRGKFMGRLKESFASGIPEWDVVHELNNQNARQTAI